MHGFVHPLKTPPERQATFIILLFTLAKGLTNSIHPAALRKCHA
jgi:hypothetical protein